MKVISSHALQSRKQSSISNNLERARAVLYRGIDSTGDCGPVIKQILWTDNFIEIFCNHEESHRLRIFRLPCALVSAMVQEHIDQIETFWEVVAGSVRYFQDSILFSTDHIFHCPVQLDSHNRPAFLLYTLSQSKEEADGIWEIEVLTNIHPPFDIEFSVLRPCERHRRYVYRIGQQYVKFYFEKYVLEQYGLLRRVGEQQDTSLQKSSPNTGSVAPSKEEEDMRAATLTKPPNYMIKALVEELVYNADNDELLIINIEKMKLEEYVYKFTDPVDLEAEQEEDEEDESEEEEGEKEEEQEKHGQSEEVEEEEGGVKVIDISSQQSSTMAEVVGPIPPYEKYSSLLNQQPLLLDTTLEVLPSSSSSPITPIPRSIVPPSNSPDEANTAAAAAAAAAVVCLAPPPPPTATATTNTIPNSPSLSPFQTQKDNERDERRERFQKSMSKIDKLKETDIKLRAIVQDNNSTLINLHDEAISTTQLVDLEDSSFDVINNNSNKGSQEVDLLMIREVLSIKAELRSSFSTRAIVEYLQNHTRLRNYFSSSICSTQTLRALADNLTLLDISKQGLDSLQVVEGDPIARIFVLLQGELELISDSEPSSSFRRQGDLLGEEVFFGEVIWHYSPYRSHSDRLLLGTWPLETMLRLVGLGGEQVEEHVVFFFKRLRLWREIEEYNRRLINTSFDLLVKHHVWREEEQREQSEKNVDDVEKNKEDNRKESWTLGLDLLPIDVTRTARLHIYQAGSEIFRQGESRHCMYIMKQGSARYYRDFPFLPQQRLPLVDDDDGCDYHAHPMGLTDVRDKSVEVECKGYLLSDDFSIFDSDDTSAISRLEVFDYRQHHQPGRKWGDRYEKHRNTLVATTRCEVFQLPLREVVKSQRVLRSLLQRSKSSYPELLLSDEQVMRHHEERKTWRMQRKVVLREVKCDLIARKTTFSHGSPHHKKNSRNTSNGESKSYRRQDQNATCSSSKDVLIPSNPPLATPAPAITLQYVAQFDQIMSKCMIGSRRNALMALPSSVRWFSSRSFSKEPTEGNNTRTSKKSNADLITNHRGSFLLPQSSNSRPGSPRGQHSGQRQNEEQRKADVPRQSPHIPQGQPTSRARSAPGRQRRIISPNTSSPISVKGEQQEEVPRPFSSSHMPRSSRNHFPSPSEQL